MGASNQGTPLINTEERQGLGSILAAFLQQQGGGSSAGQQGGMPMPPVPKGFPQPPAPPVPPGFPMSGGGGKSGEKG